MWCCGYIFFSFSGAVKVDRVVKIFHEYEERLRSSDNVPRFSYGRRMMRDDGDPNRFFLMYLLQCNTCGRDVTCSAVVVVVVVVIVVVVVDPIYTNHLKVRV